MMLFKATGYKVTKLKKKVKKELQKQSKDQVSTLHIYLTNEKYFRKKKEKKNNYS